MQQLDLDVYPLLVASQGRVGWKALLQDYRVARMTLEKDLDG